MVTVYPTAASGDDLADRCELTSVEAALFTDSFTDEDCALCQVGACIQRVSIETGWGEPLVVHGVYGTC
jgi:hypothetical protein